MKKYDTEFADGQWYLVTRIPLGAGGLPKGVLTGREEQILVWICELKQNKEIAQMAGIGIRAVKFHVSNILRKCGCESRAELIYKNQRNG